MKATIFLLAILLFSCQKEMTDIKEFDKLPTLFRSANSVQEAEVGSIIWNPCTNEWMQLSGKLLYQIKDNVAEFHYAGVTGLGLTTGNKYQCMGHQIEKTTGGNQMFLYKVSFSVPGSNNNLSQTLNVHLNAGVVENVDFKDAYCQ